VSNWRIAEVGVRSIEHQTGGFVEIIICVFDWIEAHPAFMQALGILAGATIALLAARKAYGGGAGTNTIDLVD
jgi:hypothetical protein